MITNLICLIPQLDQKVKVWNIKVCNDIRIWKIGFVIIAHLFISVEMLSNVKNYNIEPLIKVKYENTKMLKKRTRVELRKQVWADGNINH